MIPISLIAMWAEIKIIGYLLGLTRESNPTLSIHLTSYLLNHQNNNYNVKYSIYVTLVLFIYFLCIKL